MKDRQDFWDIQREKIRERLIDKHPQWDEERVKRATERKIKWIKRLGL